MIKPKVTNVEIEANTMTMHYKMNIELGDGIGVHIIGGIMEPIEHRVHRKNTPYISNVCVMPFGTFHGAGKLICYPLDPPLFCHDDCIMIDYTNKDTVVNSILNSKLLEFKELEESNDNGFTVIRHFNDHTQHYNIHVYLDSIIVIQYSIGNKSKKKTKSESDLYYVTKDHDTGEWEYKLWGGYNTNNSSSNDKEWPFCVFGTRG